MPKKESVSTKQTYKEKLEQKKNVMLAAGLVSERLPGVSNIVFHMTYYQRTPGPVLMKRTVTFFPTDYACFHMDCVQQECTNGGFDLTPVVSSMVKSRKKSVTGNIFCRGKNSSLRLGHASIAYEVNIVYAKQKN